MSGILAIADDLAVDRLAIKAGLPKESPFSDVKEFCDESSLLKYIESLRDCKEELLPCLFVLDLNIGTPNSGHRALKKIKSISNLSHIPILIASVTNRKKTIRNLYSDGANSFVSKGKTEEISAKFAQVFSYWSNVVQMPCVKK